MDFVKFAKLFHVFFLFLWVGGLVALISFLKVGTNRVFCRKHYFMLQLPCMIIAVALGIFLLVQSPEKLRLGWFHMKLTGALGLIFCDIWAAKGLSSKGLERAQKSRGSYWFMQGCTVLFLLLSLSAIYLIKK